MVIESFWNTVVYDDSLPTITAEGFNAKQNPVVIFDFLNDNDWKPGPGQANILPQSGSVVDTITRYVERSNGSIWSLRNKDELKIVIIAQTTDNQPSSHFEVDTTTQLVIQSKPSNPPQGLKTHIIKYRLKETFTGGLESGDYFMRIQVVGSDLSGL